MLEITGNDVAAFCDELVKGEKTYFDNLRKKLNSNIAKKIGMRVSKYPVTDLRHRFYYLLIDTHYGRAHPYEAQSPSQRQMGI